MYFLMIQYKQQWIKKLRDLIKWDKYKNNNNNTNSKLNKLNKYLIQLLIKVNRI